MPEPRNPKIWGSGGAQRQRYAAITARECLTALSMIKIPQMYKKPESIRTWAGDSGLAYAVCEREWRDVAAGQKSLVSV